MLDFAATLRGSLTYVTDAPEKKWIFLARRTSWFIYPIGAGGYDLSWIEAVGTLAGLLCIWLASLEKISNYAFGLINVTLFAIIFFQIQLYASLLLQLFFFAANIYGWYAWSRQNSQQEAELQIRWLPLPKAITWFAACVVAIGLMTVFIDPVFAFLTRVAVSAHVRVWD